MLTEMTPDSPDQEIRVLSDRAAPRGRGRQGCWPRAAGHAEYGQWDGILGRRMDYRHPPGVAGHGVAPQMVSTGPTASAPRIASSTWTSCNDSRTFDGIGDEIGGARYPAVAFVRWLAMSTRPLGAARSRGSLTCDQATG
jgi:hypothetical protein